MIYYTYLWLRPDGTPYYVGKGCKDRAFIQHGHRVKCPPSDQILIEHHPSEDDAFTAEVFLIAFYGRKDLGTGYLQNLSDGGSIGISGAHRGHRHSEESKEKNRRAHLGRKLTEETRAKLRIIHAGQRPPNWTGKKHKPQTLAKMRTSNCRAMLGKKLPEATRRKMSLAHRGKRQNPEWIAKRVVARLATLAARKQG
jgi:hypothetical protein